MKRLILLPALAISVAAHAVSVVLQRNIQVSNAAVISTLVWDGANDGTSWGASVGMVPSDAIWNWNGTTLTSSGLFWTTSHIGSNPLGASVVSDKVVNMVINTTAHTTSATSYECVEGSFLAGVNAHGCANVALGFNAVFDSSLIYNVGGNPYCVDRTLDGDDTSTGSPRGLMTISAIGGCDATLGAFNLYTVAASGLTPGALVILSETASLAQITNCKAAGSGSTACNLIRNQTWLEFTVVPIPAALWLLGSALGVLGMARRGALS